MDDTDAVQSSTMSIFMADLGVTEIIVAGERSTLRFCDEAVQTRAGQAWPRNGKESA
jgi:hypothetical protein